MPAAKRRRTPRKTPPGTKPLPRKISDADLEQKRAFASQIAELEQAVKQIEAQRLVLEGERNRWRNGEIWPRYQMGDDDQLEEDGTINRG